MSTNPPSYRGYRFPSEIISHIWTALSNVELDSWVGSVIVPRGGASERFGLRVETAAVSPASG